MATAVDIGIWAFVIANVALGFAIFGSALVGACLEVTDEGREWRTWVRWSEQGGAISLSVMGHAHLLPADKLTDDTYSVREIGHARYRGRIREAVQVNNLWSESWAGDLCVRKDLINGEWIETFRGKADESEMGHAFAGHPLRDGGA